MEINSFATKSKYINYLQKKIVSRKNAWHELSGKVPNGGEIEVSAYCDVCKRKMGMTICRPQGQEFVNLRESIVCTGCSLNNRQRLMVSIFLNHHKTRKFRNVYLPERVTSFFSSIVQTVPEIAFSGSEYLGPQYASGEKVGEIVHQDLSCLSYNDKEFDAIISNDVFEHVQDIYKVLKECYRVLNKEGIMLFSIPFHAREDRTVVRAKVAEGEVKYMLEPEYHGNPVSDKGSLVFYDFGWDILEFCKQAGFRSSKVGTYYSEDKGYYGIPFQIVFSAEKN